MRRTGAWGRRVNARRARRRQGAASERTVLEELPGYCDALVSEKLFGGSSGAGGAKHVKQEANGPLQCFAVKSRSHCIGWLVQVHHSLPQRGVNYAAEHAQHMVVGGDVVEALQNVIQGVADAHDGARERREGLHFAPFFGVGVGVGAGA